MPGGRPRKPTELKLLEGNPGRRHLSDSEPKPPASDQQPPAWLRGRSRRLWRKLAPRLASLHVLTNSDEEALALLADALAEYIECRAVIRAKGRTYTTTTVQGDEMVRSRPEVANASDAWRRAQRMLVEFGMTPSARSKISVDKPSGDELDALLG